MILRTSKSEAHLKHIAYQRLTSDKKKEPNEEKNTFIDDVKKLIEQSKNAGNFELRNLAPKSFYEVALIIVVCFIIVVSAFFKKCISTITRNTIIPNLSIQCEAAANQRSCEKIEVFSGDCESTAHEPSQSQLLESAGQGHRIILCYPQPSSIELIKAQSIATLNEEPTKLIPKKSSKARNAPRVTSEKIDNGDTEPEQVDSRKTRRSTRSNTIRK